jgi:hypothetical protein
MENTHVHHRSDDENDFGRPQPFLSEKSGIQIGLVALLLGFVIGSIWWAATMQSKMDQVIEEVKVSRIIQSTVSEHDTKLKIVELRVLQLEQRPIPSPSKSATAP